MGILNTGDLPRDPVEQIMWLDGVKAQVTEELDLLYEEAYFQARVTGRFDAAVNTGRASRKRALAWTRRGNEKRGRTIRWNDKADPTSTNYFRE